MVVVTHSESYLCSVVSIAGSSSCRIQVKLLSLSCVVCHLKSIWRCGDSIYNKKIFRLRGVLYSWPFWWGSLHLDLQSVLYLASGCVLVIAFRFPTYANWICLLCCGFDGFVCCERRAPCLIKTVSCLPSKSDSKCRLPDLGNTPPVWTWPRKLNWILARQNVCHSRFGLFSNDHAFLSNFLPERFLDDRSYKGPSKNFLLMRVSPCTGLLFLGPTKPIPPKSLLAKN